MKYFSPIATGLALAISGFAVQAQDFQHQASVRYGYIDLDGGSSDTLYANYSYFFDKVSTDSPFALNTFLAQSSQLDIAYTTSGSDSNSALVGGTWVSDNNWFVRGGYQTSLNDFGDAKAGNLSLGYFLNSTTEVAVNYDRADSDRDDFWGDSSYELNSWGAHARSWFELPTTQGIDAGIEYEKIDYDVKSNGHHISSGADTVTAYADWYLTKSLSLGLSAAYVKPEQSSSDTAYSASVDYWLPLGNTFSLQTGANVNLDSDDDTYGVYLALTARF